MRESCLCEFNWITSCKNLLTAGFVIFSLKDIPRVNSNFY